MSPELRQWIRSALIYLLCLAASLAILAGLAALSLFTGQVWIPGLVVLFALFDVKFWEMWISGFGGILTRRDIQPCHCRRYDTSILVVFFLLVLLLFPFYLAERIRTFRIFTPRKPISPFEGAECTYKGRPFPPWKGKRWRIGP